MLCRYRCRVTYHQSNFCCNFLQVKVQFDLTKSDIFVLELSRLDGSPWEDSLRGSLLHVCENTTVHVQGGWIYNISARTLQLEKIHVRWFILSYYFILFHYFRHWFTWDYLLYHITLLQTLIHEGLFIDHIHYFRHWFTWDYLLYHITLLQTLIHVGLFIVSYYITSDIDSCGIFYCIILHYFRH